MNAFDGVKVFSATMVHDRNILGEKVTAWLVDRAKTIDVVDIKVTQSSDDAFHCICIVLFFRRVTPNVSTGSSSDRPQSVRPPRR